MNRFERILNKNVRIDSNPISELKGSLDPRPDLRQDSILWAQLLASALDINTNLYSALHYLRCRGTGIRRFPSGNLGLYPYIDPTGNDAWSSQTEYDREKRILDPMRDDLIQLLRKVAA